MSKLDPNPVPVPGCEPCPRCGQPMQRYEHSPGWNPRPGKGHFRFWDRCKPCGHFQNYERFLVGGRRKNEAALHIARDE